jgi:hypothetical protein
MTLASVSTKVTMAQVTYDIPVGVAVAVDGETGSGSGAAAMPYYAGWCASPVPAAQVVNVTVEALNPQSNPSSWYNIPAFIGFATETGPNTPNGALLFASPFAAALGTESYGVVVWYNS